MRRKADTLLPLEISVLETAIALQMVDVGEFHGFLIAKEIAEREAARSLTAHGTLYKALDRMERARLLESRWEDPFAAAAESRPRRRLYRVTLGGAQALAAAQAAARPQLTQLQRGRAPA